MLGEDGRVGKEVGNKSPVDIYNWLPHETASRSLNPVAILESVVARGHLVVR